MIDYDRAAKQLRVIFHSTFGGKVSGKFKIKYDRFSRLVYNNTACEIQGKLREEDIHYLTISCLQYGLVLINLGHTFVFFSTTAVASARNATMDIIDNVTDLSTEALNALDD